MLAETRGGHGYREYVLTDKGLSLWPVVRDLLSWGDEYYSVNGPRRVFQQSGTRASSRRTERAPPAAAPFRRRTC